MEFSRRKWGWYWTLYSGKTFKIKFLYFRSNSELSTQRHFCRAEKWYFLFGNGAFVLNNWAISNPRSVVVDIGSWHHYQAYSPTLVLEIQTGECREDDIERAA